MVDTQGRWAAIWWWVRLIVEVLAATVVSVAGFLFVLGLGFGIFFGAVGAIAWLNVDAVVWRKYPWISIPGALAVDAWMIRWLIRENRKKRAWRAAVVERIHSQPLPCPLCHGPLAPWSGRFEPEPTRAHVVPGPVGSEADIISAYFRQRCDACGEDAWFTANRGGEIGVYGLWYIIRDEARPEDAT